MSGNSKLFEKYKKSDIFNLKDDEDGSKTERKPRTRNVQAPFQSTQNDIFNTIDTENSSNYKEPVIHKKYNLRNHKSDIFNVKDILQTPKKPSLQKFRNANNYSNCFDSMTDNEQFKIDIKDYTSKHRATKKIYNPDKYFDKEDPAGRLYNLLYDKKRNPVMMKSSANLFSNINLNEKKLFTEKKKTMRRQFTTAFLTNNNDDERKKLTEEHTNGLKNHKFFKNKGFTYKDNNYCTENNYVKPDQYPGNNSKITKQIELQSNIFGENGKNGNIDINKIKQRIKTAEENDEDRPKKENKNMNKENIKMKKNIEPENNDRNIWGAIHNNWEKSNINWKKENTEIIFGKTFSGRFPKLHLEKIKEKEKEDAFQRKVKNLSDSGFKDTINESIKSKRTWQKKPLTTRLTHTNLEQIDEVLNEIPENALKPDQKKKIIGNANTIDFNGNIGIDDKFINYKKYHKKILNKNENKKKEPIVKIMSKQDNKNNKKVLNKTVTSLKNHEDYNIHDYVLSYDSNAKTTKSNFDTFSDYDVKKIFGKKGIHIYDIQKSHFDNGKYNTIKFKIRENEGENNLNEKIKELENELTKKQYKVCIQKDVEKDKKKSLRGVVRDPMTKRLVLNEENNNKLKKNEPLRKLKKNASFSGLFTLVNHKYKK